jgi:type I restriction enzyme S subunit
MSNFVPRGWESSNIRALVKFIGGSQPPRDTFIFQKKEGYVRLLQIRDYKSDKYASFIPTSLSRRWCNKDDIMIGRYGPPIFQIMRGKEGSYNVALIKAEPKSDKLLKSYLYEFIRRDDLFHVIDSYSQRTSGQTGIDMDALNDFHFPLPPLPEQQKIAQILTSVDEVIEKTQAQIDKLKDLKIAMMQELLTKGIGHLEFKDSTVGRIPVEWEVKPLDNIIDRVIDCEHKTAPYVDKSEFLVIRTSNVRSGELIFDDMKYTTMDGFNEWTKRTVPVVGDVLFSREAPAGESCMVPTGLKVCMGQRMVLLRPNKQLIDPDFFSLYLSSEFAALAIYERSIGTTVSRINIEDIKRIPCIVPPLEEQQFISKAIQSCQSSISSKQSKLSGFISIKKALMQDLLTGKVRVNTELSNTTLAVS